MKITPNTKKARLLQWLATFQNRGRTFSEIQRFICEMNGYDFDQKETRWGKTVRVHAGIWSTNLCHGPKSILRFYCFKNSDQKWCVKPEFMNQICSLTPEFTADCTLEKANLPSDEIAGNSKVVSVERITIPEEATSKFMSAFGKTAKFEVDTAVGEGLVAGTVAHFEHLTALYRAANKYSEQDLLDAVAKAEEAVKQAQNIKRIREESHLALVAFVAKR